MTAIGAACFHWPPVSLDLIHTGRRVLLVLLLVVVVVVGRGLHIFKQTHTNVSVTHTCSSIQGTTTYYSFVPIASVKQDKTIFYGRSARRHR